MIQNILAVIPTMNIPMCLNLVENILSFEYKPAHIFIINNSGKQINSTADYSVYNPLENIGVNASWNYAMKEIHDSEYHLSILNDDIEVNEDFFSNISRAFDIVHDAGVICPLTNDQKIEESDLRYHKMNRREGWAFTIRKDIVEKIPRIPKKLFTFCGDDWIFYHTNKLGLYWYKDTMSKIKHKIGFSLLKSPYFRNSLRSEKETFQKIISKIS